MRNDDDFPRRENMMERRLRKARGEEVPDELELYDDYDDREDDRPRGLGGGYQGYARAGGGYGVDGAGCGRFFLYGALVLLVAVVGGGLFFNQTLGRLFAGVPRLPDVNTIIVTPTPRIITGAAVVQRVRQLSRLETASYTVQTVIDVRQDSSIPIVGEFIAGDELLLIAHGTVVAGVDLSSLAPDAVTVTPDGRTITLRLPPAEIFATNLDSQKTRVYSRERGIFAPENKDLESLARQQAEEQILTAACEDGILSKATTQAETALQQFLSLLDEGQAYQIVTVAAAAGPCAPPTSP